jgi:subtilase family serine protease
MVAVAALAACSQTGGGSTIPAGRSGLDPQTLRAIPIYSPSPSPQPGRGPQTLRAIPIYSPSPTPAPGLIGGLVAAVTDLTCGVTAGVTCHVLAGAGPQGLPAGTAAAALPGLHPADLQDAYDFPSASAGAGQTIGIIVAYDDPSLESDLGVYRAKFGLPACTSNNGCFKKITAGGLLGTLLGSNQGWGQEASIDTQIASAVCPKCKLVVVEAQSDSPAALLAAARTAVAHGATVVSNSYSLDESAGENDADYAIGVPFVFGAGDAGAGAQWPAASTHVIAVGGTSLARDGSARGWSESVWAGTGGGCSAYIDKPAWQHDAACANRTANDIAAFADPNPGVAVYDSFLSRSAGWRTYGGTSVSAPIVAAAIALAGNGKSALLDAAYIYDHAAALNPVTAGRNGGCASYLCAAGAGYSAPAGNGSPRGTGAL